MKENVNEQVIPTVEIITPSIAEKYLKMNTQNRKANKGTIRRYSTDMKNNNWKVNGQTVVFDKDGNLRDGQNRLFACVTAGVPFKTVVVRGVDPEAFDSMDTGHKRNMADMFTAANIANANELMQVISKFFGLDKGKWSLTSEGDTNLTASGLYGNKNILGREEYQNNQAYYDNIVDWLKKIKKEQKAILSAMKLSIGDIGGCSVYLNKCKGHDLEKVRAFFNELCLRADVGKTRCISDLRNILIKNKQSVTKMTPKGVQSTIAKAWNLYKNGKGSKKLSCSVEEQTKGVRFE